MGRARTTPRVREGPLVQVERKASGAVPAEVRGAVPASRRRSVRGSSELEGWRGDTLCRNKNAAEQSAIWSGGVLRADVRCKVTCSSADVREEQPEFDTSSCVGGQHLGVASAFVDF